MTDSIKILAPAKLNIFLKVINKREDGFHNIRSGITFINLFDEIEIRKSKKLIINYKGLFQPKSGKYDNCIISKTLDYLFLDKDINLEISIKKNIPVQGGLGSASTNAAALIEGLSLMNLIQKEDIKNYVFLGADIPCFLYKNNCLSMGLGEKIFPAIFPKYYFLIVKPNFNNSTKFMYENLDLDQNRNIDSDNIISNETSVNDDDNGNDFEKSMSTNVEFKNIFETLENLDNVIFSRMTGSGSCCYAVFEKKEFAINANNTFRSIFKKLWTSIAENNYK